MSSRVAGAGLALIAAALLAASVASPVILPAQLSLFAGHPTVKDRLRDLQDVYVGFYDAQLCNTGGDGTCVSGDTKPAFHWLGYGTLAATGVVTVSATVLALLTIKRSERRRTAALVVRLAGLAALATGGAMVWQAPFTSAQVPIGPGAALYGASVLLAIVASLIAVRMPPRIKLRVADREPAELLDTVRNASWINRGPPPMGGPPAMVRQPPIGPAQVSREPPPPAIDMEALFGEGEPSTQVVDYDPSDDPHALPELPAVSGELMQPEPAARPGTEPRSATAVRRAMKDAAFQGAAGGLVMQRPVIPRPIAPGEIGPPPPPLVPWPSDGPASGAAASSSWASGESPLLPPPPPPITVPPTPVPAPAQGAAALAIAAAPPIAAPPPRLARDTLPPPTPPARASRETVPPPPARAAGEPDSPPPGWASETQPPPPRTTRETQPPPPRATRESQAAPPPPRPARTTIAPPAAPAPRTPSDSQPPAAARGLRAAVPMPERPATTTRPPPVTAAPLRIAPSSRIGKPATVPPPFVIPPIPAIRPGVPAGASASGPAMPPPLAPPLPAEPRASSISDGTAARFPSEAGDTTVTSQGTDDKTADDSGPFTSGLIAPPGEPDTSPTGEPVRRRHVNGKTVSPVASGAGAKLPISTAPQSLPPPKEDPTQHGPTPACPQCESPMTWVDEHLRFYCKSCRMYF